MATVGWQTAFGDEFDEEWPDDLQMDASNDRDEHLEVDVDGGEMEPTTDIMRSPTAHGSSLLAVGTFVIHHDKPITPMQPKVQKTLRKDIFTPLKLETMFNPPSPQETRVPTPEQSLDSSSSKRLDPTPERSVPFLFNGRDSSNTFPFTFSVRRSPPVQHNCADPQVDKSRLRLFHLHYDTFTREHLSALVDAIPVSSSSLSASSASIHDGINSSSSPSHYRPAKRIKLSPPGHLPGARRRPRLSLPRVNTPADGRKDYIRESKPLVQAIADARSFSTQPARTRPLAKRRLEREEDVKEFGENVRLEAQEKLKDAKQGVYSSLGFRRQAADSMVHTRRDTQRNISPMSIADEISALSIDENPPLQSLGQRSPSVSVPRALVGTMSPNVREKLALRAERAGSGSGSALFRTTHLAAVANHLDSTNALSRPNTLPQLSQARVSRSTQDLSRPISTSSSTALSTAPSVKHPGWPLTVGVSEFAPTTQTRLEISTLNPNSHRGNLTTHNSASGVRITQIIPADVPELLERVGNMVLNRQKMVWVKETGQDPNRNADTGETSDDPFRDFESLADGDSERLVVSKRPLEADEEMPPHLDSDEDSTLSATQDHNGREKRNVGEISTFTDHGADDGSEPDVGVTQDLLERQPSAAPLLEKDWTISWIRNVTTDGQRIHSTLSSDPAKEPLPTPLRSALKPGIPASSESTPHPSIVSRTAGVAPRRSVSFSDGRTSGRIRGLHDSQTDGSQSLQSLQSFPDVSIPAQVQDAPVNNPSELFEPSVRADRIAEMLECLEDDSADLSPSKAIHSPANPVPLQVKPHTSGASSLARSSDLSPSKAIHSTANLVPLQVKPHSRRGSSVARSANTTTRTHVNATFLTECSFGIAHDRLVQCITDAQTFEPRWEDLLSIDLSGKQLDSVARLKEFLPSLDTLKLDDNVLPWLSGIPSTVHVLSAVRNRLTSLTSYTHLSKLEVLDISHNEIDSLIQLECLRRLRELRADNNAIRDFTGLMKLENLKKLSLAHNKIEEVDLERCCWVQLELLNLSANGLRSLLHISNVETLHSLILDNNLLDSLHIEEPMPHLRSLRLSDNRLTQLDVGHLRALKTLYADRNRLTILVGAERLERFETLSLRQQSGKGLSLSSRDVRDVRRLYLSGNSLAEWYLTEPCYNLVYLEAARCQIRELPANLTMLIPNIRTLNLNFNFISDVQPLQGLARLRKLSLVGSHVQGTRSLIRAMRRMTELELVDFRMNPCTLSWYMPIIDRGSGFIPSYLTTSNGEKGDLPPAQVKSQVQAVEEDKEAQAVDAKFRRGLPDDLYVGRLVYRGLLAAACGPKLCVVDGVKLTEAERDKAAALLRDLEARLRTQATDANAHSGEDKAAPTNDT